MGIEITAECDLESAPQARNLPVCLPDTDLLEQLRLEKRRAEHSHAPLSLLLIFRDDNPHGPSSIQDLLEPLRNLVRKTDRVHSKDPDTLALLLPDTDAAGAELLKRKLASNPACHSCAILTATYPASVLILSFPSGAKYRPGLQGWLRSEFFPPPQPGPRGSGLLPPADFLQRVRLEKRRAERSRRPLSITLVQVPAENLAESGPSAEWLAALGTAARDIAVIGQVGAGTLGILFPDTDAKGAEAILQNLLDRPEYHSTRRYTATYPYQLFELLTDTTRHRPELDLLFLDEGSEPSGMPRFLKRGLDILGSLSGIILLSPLLLAVGLAVKATSPGPALFSQIRLGKRGARFRLYKFRSMYRDMDDRIHRDYVRQLIQGNLAAIDQGESEQPLYKIKSDPRVTRIGRILRKTSLDELPQLFNVLKGDMSLVGPRPALPYEAEQYQPWQLRRILEIKPGITGLWQVEGRSKTSFDEMVRLDLRYIENWSLGLDLKLLLKTVKVVLQCRGAC